MKLTLIRGLPGSGKSTAARDMTHFYGGVAVEADHYFEVGNLYLYDSEWLKCAHRRCFRITQAALLEGHDVYVANTFTRVWEMQGYIDMADRIPMVDLLVLKCVGEYGSTHAVPAKVLARMTERWEDYESENVYNG